MLFFLPGKIQLLLFLPLFFKENKGFKIMSLIECPDCKKQISDHAPTCPNCGRPMSAPTIQTIEATGKIWKGIQLIGALLMCIGVISCVCHIADTSSPASLTPTWCLLGGFTCYIIGRIGAFWWHE